MPETPAVTPDPTPDVQVVQGPKAKTVWRKAKRVAAWNATNVGVLAVAADHLREVHHIFKTAADGCLAITDEEIKLAAAFAKRLARRARELARLQAHGMEEASRILNVVDRLLHDADKGGYGIQRLQQQAISDRALLERLRASLRVRVTESAAVLADLEQAVDPVPEFKMVSHAQRKANAKTRKKMLDQAVPLAADHNQTPKPSSLTSDSSR